MQDLEEPISTSIILHISWCLRIVHRMTLEPRAQPIPWRAHEAADAEWFAELDVLERKLKETGPRPRDEL